MLGGDAQCLSGFIIFFIIFSLLYNSLAFFDNYFNEITLPLFMQSCSVCCLGKSRDVVMADTSRRSSEELEPDLSSETAPKKFKRCESSDELPAQEHLTKSAGTSSQTSAIPLQAGSTSEQKRDKQSSLDVAAEAAGTPERSALIGSETSAESSEQLIQINPEFSEGEGDTATISEAIPSTSQEVQPGILRSIVMKYNDPEDPSPTEITVVSHVNIRTFSLHDDTTYEDLCIIGNGAYGTVYKAKDRSSGQVVALKKVRIPLSEDGLPVFTLREIAALKSLEPYEHPNIVSNHRTGNFARLRIIEMIIILILIILQNGTPLVANSILISLICIYIYIFFFSCITCYIFFRSFRSNY